VRARPIITANCDNVAKKQPVDLEDPRIEERGSEKLICLPPLPKKEKKQVARDGRRTHAHARAAARRSGFVAATRRTPVHIRLHSLTRLRASYAPVFRVRAAHSHARRGRSQRRNERGGTQGERRNGARRMPVHRALTLRPWKSEAGAKERPRASRGPQSVPKSRRLIAERPCR